MTLEIKYEKSGYSFYANNKFITDYSRAGLERAKRQVEETVKILEMLGVTPRVVLDTDNVLQKRNYQWKPRAGRVTV